jgi:ABC-2 type transport system permease protein
MFGFLNPVIAKITPELVKSFMPGGISIDLPSPSAADSWMQFFKNVPQMGLAVLAILFSGMMAGEIQKGTLVLMVTKGLSRTAVLCSKFTVAVLLWTASYAVCTGVTYGYTVYFWKMEGIDHLVAALLGVWLFGVLLLASDLLGSVISKSSYSSLLFTGIMVAVMFLLNIVPKIQEFNPIRLVSEPYGLITGTLRLSDFSGNFLAAGVLLLILLVLSGAAFGKKQL